MKKTSWPRFSKRTLIVPAKNNPLLMSSQQGVNINQGNTRGKSAG